jgi:hypothetical protein
MRADTGSTSVRSVETIAPAVICRLHRLTVLRRRFMFAWVTWYAMAS